MVSSLDCFYLGCCGFTCCLFPLSIYGIFILLYSLIDFNINYISFFYSFCYYIIGPCTVGFIIMVYFQVNREQAPYDMSSFVGKKVSHINQKLIDYATYKVMLLVFFWGFYYLVYLADQYVPLYGVHILYEFGRGLCSSLLSIIRMDFYVDMNFKTFTSNFLSFYGSLCVIEKIIQGLSLVISY